MNTSVKHFERNGFPEFLQDISGDNLPLYVKKFFESKPYEKALHTKNGKVSYFVPCKNAPVNVYLSRHFILPDNLAHQLYWKITINQVIYYLMYDRDNTCYAVAVEIA